MIILPAIDLKGGVCVRLRQGRADDVTTYNDDPAAQARDWRTQGGRELHVVDLDGAFAGTPRHAEVIRAIIEAFGGPVEVGGGLRTPEALDAVLAAGAARAIIGSAALENPAFLAQAVEQYGDRITAGIDARDEKAEADALHVVVRHQHELQPVGQRLKNGLRQHRSSPSA